MQDFVKKITNFIRDIPQAARIIIIAMCAMIVLLGFIPFIKKSYGQGRIAVKISTIIVTILCIGIIILLCTFR